MSENGAIIAGEPSAGIRLAEAIAIGRVMAESNLFDVRNYAQAVVKILAGAEMGFGPAASMADVHVIEGKPSIGAHLRAAAVKRSERYDYAIVRLDRVLCELEFFELAGGAAGAPRKGKAGWVSVGRVVTTFEEFVQSGVALKNDGKTLKANWARAPDDMLFARAISKGYRRYCPDLSGGVLAYCPEEMEAVEIHDAEYAVTPPATNGTPAAATPTPAPEPIPSPPREPLLSPPPVKPAPVSQEQADRIDTLAGQLRIPRDVFERQIHRDFGHLSPAQLTAEQAEQVIERMETRLKQKQAAPANPPALPAK